MSVCVGLCFVLQFLVSMNRYNQVPHLTQDTNGKVTDSHLDISNESQDVCPLPAGDLKVSINRRTRNRLVSSFAIISLGTERAGCFNLIAF